ncbi:hypothetical protein [Klebsiella quasipneumoniae]|uniref:hypothetical protein n=2 Tax=Klebsiella quasipneumoniae TaxID=1463165 RepID=UPI002DBC468E|nr:hypothetical protein [Klebsiella quasipneumoniae]EIY4994522.1 hypothetical protein [Klebsiella quasipneumoniae]MEB6582927.1 hypothetical protein [Klebsiella quasipneumoniae]HBW1752508.1 hypothetical protein [Klebsiella quasipneumoniae subsp. similipneumoniae]
MKLTPVFIKRCHLVAAVMWVGLAIPSLIWWKDSVLWVILISIYANIVGHLSGYSAARADQAAEENEDSPSNK